MAALPHPPQPNKWLQRISFALAVALCLLGLLALAIKFIYPDASSQIMPEMAAVKTNAVLAVFLLGVVLLMIELGSGNMAWLALVPALIGTLTLVEDFFHFNLGIDELLVRDYSSADSAAPGRMHFMAAACLLLAGSVLAWKAFAPRARAHSRRGVRRLGACRTRVFHADRLRRRPVHDLSLGRRRACSPPAPPRCC